jgi:hypothetical protein
MSSVVAAQNQQEVSVHGTVVRYRTIDVGGIRIFYRDGPGTSHSAPR